MERAAREYLLGKEDLAQLSVKTRIAPLYAKKGPATGKPFRAEEKPFAKGPLSSLGSGQHQRPLSFSEKLL
jgi:hypothetical protein